MPHLPSSHNFRLLQNLDASGARLLMATTYLEADDNLSASVEGLAPAEAAHFVNLGRSPYCLRPPEAVFYDGASGRRDQGMALWELDTKRPLLLSGDCGGWELGNWAETSVEVPS